MSSPPLVLSADERAALRAVWRRMIPRDGSVWDVPFFRRSLLSLAAQGYVLQDIGAMFGVSRERARQWFAILGVRACDLRNGSRRVWDWKRRRFVAVASTVVAQHRTRPCECGCGKPCRKRFARGCNPRQYNDTWRQNISIAAKKRWARTLPDERAVIGQKISRSWSVKDRRAARDRMLARWAAKETAA